jgi:hypothetical protein
MPQFAPFADDVVSTSIGQLTIENGTDRIALYGTLDITRDRQGLANAQALKAVVDQTVQCLAGETDLPNTVAPDAVPKTVRNPFA